MADEIRPAVGEWYKDTEGHIFEVVAMDEDENYIEIQHFGGGNGGTTRRLVRAVRRFGT
jgi:hypothetical protein